MVSDSGGTAHPAFQKILLPAPHQSWHSELYFDVVHDCIIHVYIIHMYFNVFSTYDYNLIFIECIHVFFCISAYKIIYIYIYIYMIILCIYIYIYLIIYIYIYNYIYNYIYIIIYIYIYLSMIPSKSLTSE